MSLKSNELMRTIQKGTQEDTPNVRMATIKSLVSGKYTVRFYGEDADSQKAYMKMSGVTITSAKPVLMQKINGTYIIMGNIN